MALTLDVKKAGAVTVVGCRGVIVYGAESEELRARLKELLASTHSLVLDMAEVGYVDSGGLGAIVGLLTSARAAGGDLKLARPSERVQHVLRITKLLSVVETYDTVEAAVATYGHAAA